MTWGVPCRRLRCALCGAVLCGALLCTGCAAQPGAQPSAPELYYLLDLDEGPNDMLQLPQTVGAATFAGPLLPADVSALPPQPLTQTPLGAVAAVVSFGPALPPVSPEPTGEESP
ncbi:MAG: hypothetical protein AB7N76_22280 [Planctomycetota bacterium]